MWVNWALAFCLVSEKVVSRLWLRGNERKVLVVPRGNLAAWLCTSVFFDPWDIRDVFSAFCEAEPIFANRFMILTICFANAFLFFTDLPSVICHLSFIHLHIAWGFLFYRVHHCICLVIITTVWWNIWITSNPCRHIPSNSCLWMDIYCKLFPWSL